LLSNGKTASVQTNVSVIFLLLLLSLPPLFHFSKDTFSSPFAVERIRADEFIGINGQSAPIFPQHFISVILGKAVFFQDLIHLFRF